MVPMIPTKTKGTIAYDIHKIYIMTSVLYNFFTKCEDRVIEILGLEKTSKTIWSSHHPTTNVTH